MVAGHDTTSASLVWVFFELSRHPDVQHKLREEIRATRAAAASGLGKLEFAELESMTYTLAVIKFSLISRIVLLSLLNTSASLQRDSSLLPHCATQRPDGRAR
jgi:Cytochrome P450